MNKEQQLTLFDSVTGYVFWLKVPEYHVPWLLAHYGCPVVFPSKSVEAGEVRWGLVANKTGAQIHACCLTAAMYRDAILSDEERLSWVPIAMPSHIVRHGNSIFPTDRWQLATKAVVALREQIRFSFWCDLAKYINDTTYTAVCHGEHITLDRQFFDWMDLHNIDWSYGDTLLRQFHRDRREDEKEITARLRQYAYDIDTNQQQLLARINDHRRRFHPQLQELRARHQRYLAAKQAEKPPSRASSPKKQPPKPSQTAFI